MSALKRLILSKAGELSFTKLGAWIVSVSSALLVCGVDFSDRVDNVLKIIIAVGAAVGIAGARDAKTEPK